MSNNDNNKETTLEESILKLKEEFNQALEVANLQINNLNETIVLLKNSISRSVVPTPPNFLRDILEVRRRSGRCDYLGISSIDNHIWACWQPTPYSPFFEWKKSDAIAVRKLGYTLHADGRVIIFAQTILTMSH